MTSDNPYWSVEILEIPIPNLKQILEDELTNLLFDFGQKVGLSNDPEFDYLVSRTCEVLRQYYPNWKLHYLDKCLRQGKLDHYDRGQKVTLKRLELWFKSFNVSTADKRKVQSQEKLYTPQDNERFISNLILKKAMIYRQTRPAGHDFKIRYFDDENGHPTELREIAKTEEFKAWLGQGGDKLASPIENRIFSKI